MANYEIKMAGIELPDDLKDVPTADLLAARDKLGQVVRDIDAQFAQKTKDWEGWRKRAGESRKFAEMKAKRIKTELVNRGVSLDRGHARRQAFKAFVSAMSQWKDAPADVIQAAKLFLELIADGEID